MPFLSDGTLPDNWHSSKLLSESSASTVQRPLLDRVTFEDRRSAYVSCLR